MDRPDRYTRTAIALHWLVGIALLAQMAFGWMLTEIPRQTPARGFYVNLHKSTGLTLAALIVLRLLWRLAHRPPPLPPGIERWQCRAALATHRMLYALMLLMPLSGYVASNFSRHGLRYFGHALAPWGPDLPAVYQVLNGVHVVSAWLLAALIALHVAAALQHAWIGRDDVVSRILPRLRG
jgi:cytochrome b561